jgi:hypothetical protein
MQARDAAEVVEMARELAAVVGDPAPAVSESDLVGDGFGPERFEGSGHERIANQLVRDLRNQAVEPSTWLRRAYDAAGGDGIKWSVTVSPCG